MFLPSENTLSKSHSKLLIAQILAIDNYFVMDQRRQENSEPSGTNLNEQVIDPNAHVVGPHEPARGGFNLFNWLRLQERSIAQNAEQIRRLKNSTLVSKCDKIEVALTLIVMLSITICINLALISARLQLLKVLLQQNEDLLKYINSIQSDVQNLQITQCILGGYFVLLQIWKYRKFFFCCFFRDPSNPPNPPNPV